MSEHFEYDTHELYSRIVLTGAGEFGTIVGGSATKLLIRPIMVGNPVLIAYNDVVGKITSPRQKDARMITAGGLKLKKRKTQRSKKIFKAGGATLEMTLMQVYNFPDGVSAIYLGEDLGIAAANTSCGPLNTITRSANCIINLDAKALYFSPINISDQVLPVPVEIFNQPGQLVFVVFPSQLFFTQNPPRGGSKKHGGDSAVKLFNVSLPEPKPLSVPSTPVKSETA